MSDNRKTPIIRFLGFNDGWEQRKVGELLVERNIQSPKDDNYPLMAFIAYQGVAPKGDRYNREFLVTDGEIKKYKQTELGDFIYSSNNLTTGSIGLNKYGNASISPVYSVFKPTEIADSDFVGRSFIRKNFINKMIRWRQGVVYGQWRIHEADFLEIETYAPSVEEQKKIGKVFDELDNLITLHQRKYDKLLLVKKSMLEKMFPKEGEVVPEIRFSGFAEDWEQCKLSDVVDFLDEKRKPLESGSREPGPYPYYGASGIIDYVKDYIFDQELILLSEDGANIIDRNYRVSFLARGKYWVNNHAHVLKSKANHSNGFICESLERLDYTQYNTGTAQPKLNQEVCRNIEIYIPDYKEQMKISNLFEKLDNLISLHQRKLEKLKIIKKSMLEKMFV